MRRQRETGLKGLGQVLKSFRDRAADFPIYDRGSGADAFLHTLGPLATPGQGSRAGVNVLDPRTALSAEARPGLAAAAMPMFKGRTGTD